jgi:hypothetical protein
MPISYDKDGNCTRCGLPGSGFVADGVCMCLDDIESIPISSDERTQNQVAGVLLLREAQNYNPIYELSDIINRAFAEMGVQSETVVGSTSVQYDIVHGGRKIRFFMQYDED